MKFIKIKAKNFLSFKELELDLDNRGLILLTGKNLDDKSGTFDKNGIGKSSLVASIFYALFGETPDGRSADAIINKDAKKNASVELTLEVSGNTYVITRGRKKNVLSITLNGEPMEFSTMKETQANIEQIIGIPEEVFRTTLFFDGHYTTPFSEMTDKQKKEFLSAIVDLSIYSKAHDKTKEEIKETKAQIASVDSNITIASESSKRELENVSRLRTTKEQYEHNLTTAQATLDNYDDQNYQTLSNNLLEASKELEYVSAYKTTNTAQNALREALTASQSLSSELAELQSKQRELVAHVENLKSVMKSKMDMVKQYEQLNQSAYTKDNLVASYNYGANGSSVDAIDAIIPSGATNLETVAKLKEELANLIAEYKSTDTSVYDQPIVEATAKQDEARQAVQKLQEEANKEIEDNNTLNSRYQMANNKVNQIKEQIRNEEQAKKNLESQVTSAKSSLELVNQQLASYGDVSTDNAESVIEDLQAKKQTLATNLVNLEKVLGAFSDKGIKSHVLDLVTPTLNEGDNKYLGTLTGGAINVEFSTQSKKADGTLSDKFDISVTYNGDVMSYNALSSGEKRRVDVAISLALQDMVIQRYGADVNLLAYDELFESLDATGAENVVELLKSRIEKVGTIIVVSHNEDLKPLFDNSLEVIKKDGVSTLEGN
jgi:DNA repair exonuclease SbcCD ATPase subunit